MHFNLNEFQVCVMVWWFSRGNLFLIILESQFANCGSLECAKTTGFKINWQKKEKMNKRNLFYKAV